MGKGLNAFSAAFCAFLAGFLAADGHVWGAMLNLFLSMVNVFVATRWWDELWEEAL